MNRRRFLVTTAAAMTAAPVLGKKRPDAHPPLDLDTLLEVTEVPGIAAKGQIDGESFLHFAGVREVGKPDPVAAGTLFSAASLTKPVFAMEVRRLAREGKLDWHRPLQDYLPLDLTGDAASITAEHVLTHGTGLVNWRFDSKQTLASSFKPGTRWGYSGEGYVLLQRVVEKIAGRPLGIDLNETLLPRLGMTNSTFTWTPDVDRIAVAGHDDRGRLLEKSANSYARSFFNIAQKAGTTPDKMTYDEIMEANRKFNGLPLPVAVMPNAAGSLWTTIGDYATFLDRSARDAAEHPDEYTPRNRVNRKISWTLSWGVDASLDVPGYFHWGDGPGVKNFAWWRPAKKTAVVIFTNGDHGASTWRFLLRHLLGADPLSPEWI